MTVRPVDLQVVVQKSAELMKSRQEEAARTRLQLQQQAQQLQQKEKVQNPQVKNLEIVHKKAVQSSKERDGMKQNREQGCQGGKNKKNKEVGGTPIIDIKI